jgi:hypothetical protein
LRIHHRRSAPLAGREVEDGRARRAVDQLSHIPLYRDELQFKLDNGTGRLLDLFDEARVNELFDPTRPSVVPPTPPKRTFPWSNLLSRKTPK